MLVLTLQRTYNAEMLEIHKIRENKEAFILALRKRGMDHTESIDGALELDDQRRSAQKKLDELRHQLNMESKAIGQLFKSGEREAADIKKSQIGQLKSQIEQVEDKFNLATSALEESLLNIPNIPHPSVPMGQSDSDNEIYKDWTDPLPELMESAKPHWELAEEHGFFDFKLGVKITGSGFPLFRAAGAKLQRALIAYFLDQAAAAGYEEIMPPLIVNPETAKATGQLPDKEGQMYYIGQDNFYLIPTAEVPLTNIYRDEIVSEDDLPIKICGHTPCFRREAGSYGAHVKGLNRVHQFDKVEIVQIAHPNKSYEVLEEMVAHVESLMINLKLPYRILRLCGGDLGWTSAITFDFEAYSAAQKRWLEVSSVSNFETFQSNRLKLRFRNADKKIQLAHTLNGSALALARIVATILENYQTEEGIKVPEVLLPYTKFEWLAKND